MREPTTTRRLPGEPWTCPNLHRKVVLLGILAHVCARCGAPMHPIGRPAPVSRLPLFLAGRPEYQRPADLWHGEYDEPAHPQGVLP